MLVPCLSFLPNLLICDVGFSVPLLVFQVCYYCEGGGAVQKQ